MELLVVLLVIHQTDRLSCNGIATISPIAKIYHSATLATKREIPSIPLDI
jgi:hypothetical protein